MANSYNMQNERGNDNFEYMNGGKVVMSGSAHRTSKKNGTTLMNGVKVIMSGSAVKIPKGEKGVTLENARRVVLGVCNNNQLNDLHVFLLKQKTVAGDFTVPEEAVFVKVRTVDIIGAQNAQLEQGHNFLGFWANVLDCSDNTKQKNSFAHTTVEYGDPTNNVCSSMLVELDPELGPDPCITMNFCSNNTDSFNLGNINIIVKNPCGTAETVSWEHLMMENSRSLTCYDTGQDMKVVHTMTPDSHTKVIMNERGDLKCLSFEFQLNNSTCDPRYAKTRTSEWEIWFNLHGTQTLIHKILFE